MTSPPLTGGNCAGPGCCKSEELLAQDEHKSLLWVGLSTYNTHGVSPEWAGAQGAPSWE